MLRQQSVPSRPAWPLPPPRPCVLPEGEPRSLPRTFRFDGAVRSTDALLVETDTEALLVLVDGHVRHEYYALTGGPDVPWLSMSVAKSFVSALVGIALGGGAHPVSRHTGQRLRPGPGGLRLRRRLGVRGVPARGDGTARGSRHEATNRDQETLALLRSIARQDN